MSVLIETKDQTEVNDGPTSEELDLLAASFLPVIREFYESEQGKKMWEEYLKTKK